jgi:hypothetical protein
MTNYVTTNPQQNPIPAAPVTDPLMREVYAYVARLRAQAKEHREAADELDAAADRAEPVPVVLIGAS